MNYKTKYKLIFTQNRKIWVRLQHYIKILALIIYWKTFAKYACKNENKELMILKQNKIDIKILKHLESI